MMTPTESGYWFREPVVLGELIAGAINEGAQKVASPGKHGHSWTIIREGVIAA